MHFDDTSRRLQKRVKSMARKTKKEQYLDLLTKWEKEGYNVDALKEKVEGERFPYKLFKKYQVNIATLRLCEKELNAIDCNEREKKRIMDLIKEPTQAKEVKEWINELKADQKEDFFLNVVEETTAMDFVEETDTFENSMEAGFSYLVKDPDMDKSFKTFEILLKKGYSGMCISREFPDKIKKNHDMEGAKIIWLSNVEHEYAVNPVNLGNIYHMIEQFLMKNKENTVILLSGMEYLISQNNYKAILKLVQLLNDQVAVNQSMLIVPVLVEALENTHIRMLERELSTIE